MHLKQPNTLVSLNFITILRTSVLFFHTVHYHFLFILDLSFLYPNIEENPAKFLFHYIITLRRDRIDWHFSVLGLPLQRHEGRCTAPRTESTRNDIILCISTKYLQSLHRKVKWSNRKGFCDSSCM